jgi:hypothetical protein
MDDFGDAQIKRRGHVKQSILPEAVYGFISPYPGGM